MASLTTRNAAALLKIVHDGLSASADDPFPPSALRALAELIPSDAYVGYQDIALLEPRGFRIVELVEVVGEPTSAAVDEACCLLGHQNPLRCRLHAREQRVLQLSELLTRRERRRLAFDAEVWRPLGIDDALRVWLPAPAGRARSIYLERGGRRYDDREKTLLALLRPYFVRMQRDAASGRSARERLGLSAREVEVLGWVREGRTNAEIARILHLSPHTVRKHLENVFAKLEVRTRTAAAARLRAVELSV